MDTERLRMRLGIMQTKNFKTLITLKSKRYEPFVAKVKDFLYDEDDTKVVLEKCEGSEFPDNGLPNEQGHYVTYIKNLKSVDRFQDKKKT